MYYGEMKTHQRLKFVSSQSARVQSFIARKPEVHSNFLTVKNFSSMYM